MRKGVLLNEGQDLVDLQFAKINNLKIEADNKEQELEAAR